MFGHVRNVFGLCTSAIFSNQQSAPRLKHSHGSGDPDCLEGALQEAQDHGLDEEHLVPAQVGEAQWCHGTMLLLLAYLLSRK